MYKLISSVFVFLFFLFGIINLKASEGIIKKINILEKTLEKITKDNFKSTELISKTINEIYDTKKMIKMIVGNEWKKLDKAQQKNLTNVFQEYIAYNYVQRFSKIEKFSFEIGSLNEIGKNYKILKTFLVIPDEEKVEINYLFRKKQDSWKIFDVLLSGTISEIATKKSDFNKVIKSEGIKKLAQTLKKKMGIQ